jgi:nitrogen-specific signal transduction histidine kinase
MQDELDKGDMVEAKAKSKDIKQNLGKISHHSKRADAIVKVMLTHSRTGSDKKELTDLNALAEEYLRLAYHGIQAKDRNFSGTYKYEPDPRLPKLELVHQDIGRVLLNLINNAFYACAERLAMSQAELGLSAITEKQKTTGTNYVPEVKISMKQFSPSEGSQVVRRERTLFANGAGS